VQLYADGKAKGDPVTLNASGEWKYTWTNLPKNKDGKEIVYTVDETETYEGYTTSDPTGSAAEGFTITNTHKRMYGGLIVRKATAGNDPNKKSWFAFKISLSDKTISGTYGDVTFENGESVSYTAAQLKDKLGETTAAKVKNVPDGYVVATTSRPIYILGLPAGITYTLVEDDYSDTYDTTTYSNSSETKHEIIGVAEAVTDAEGKAAVTKELIDEKAAANDVTVTNTRDRNKWIKIVKKLDGNAVDDDQEFTFVVELTDRREKTTQVLCIALMDLSLMNLKMARRPLR